MEGIGIVNTGILFFHALEIYILLISNYLWNNVTY